MTQGDIKKEINNFKSIFEPFFETILSEFVDIAKAEKKPESFQLITEQIKRLCMLSGAKRIRPFLTYVGYSLYSDINSITLNELESILRTGSGLEIFHTSALVYDDIIDKSDTRRGEPTIEAFYKNKFQSEDKETYLHNAVSATILAGIMSHSLADKQVNMVQNKSVRDFYYEMQYELIAGQVDDTLGVGTSNLDELKTESIISMMVAKSGNYSVQKPLLFGLLLAGCPVESDLYKSVELLGYKSGILFQLIDDIIGLFETESGIGKSNTTDILEGKRTLLIERLYQLANKVNKNKIKNILGNSNATIDDIQWIKNEIITSGTLDYYKKYTENLADESTEIIEGLKNDNNQKSCETLSSFIDYLLSRTK